MKIQTTKIRSPNRYECFFFFHDDDDDEEAMMKEMLNAETDGYEGTFHNDYDELELEEKK